jgi:hypothetical protein
VVRSTLGWRNRWLWLGLGAIALLVALLGLGGTVGAQLESGSTWNRGPSGYSAWYETLEQQGVAVQRWQRPVGQLLAQVGDGEDGETTLVVVLPGFVAEGTLAQQLPWMGDWLGAGHRLVVLGVQRPVTPAPFAQTIPSDWGPVEIHTRRRQGGQGLLGDNYGAVVWERSPSTGELLFSVTPHLAANAYQQAPGNFALLTAWVTAGGGTVWVDEYLHGYRDEAAIAAELGSDHWLGYLARTPWLVLSVQALVITLVALLALNRRLGPRRPVPAATIDNSQAYITALAGVLHKANSHDFVVQTLGQAERLALQKHLGLGETPVPDPQLESAWRQYSGHDGNALAPLLQATPPRTEAQLRTWLQQLQSVHRLINPRTPGHE